MVLTDLDQWVDDAGYSDSGLLKPDGFDEACIGVATTFEPGGVHRQRLVYDVRRMAEILMSRDGMSEEDALEYLDFNVLGAYVGENQPAYLVDRRNTSEKAENPP